MKHRVPMSNVRIAEILAEIGAYLEMQKIPFKPRAYEHAAEIIGGLEEELAETYARGGLAALKEIPAVGQAIAEKIEELVTTGRLKYYEELKKKVPVNLSELGIVEGLGPKSIAKLYERLGVRSMNDLERAAKMGKIAKLEGFGAKSEENILKGIEFHKSAGGRRPIFVVMPEVRRLEEILRKLPGVLAATAAGSVRRRKEMIGDADILVVSKKAEDVMQFFTTMPGVQRVFAHGETKSSVLLASGLQVDLRVVPSTSAGAALNYFTGSKEHNVALRQLAITKGLKLNEYGLFKDADRRGPIRGQTRTGKEKMIAGRTEEEIYKALGLAYIEPELREDTGEIAAALRQAEGKPGKLPDLIGYDDLRGDLQVQTDWTDGKESIETMARSAAKRGLSYIAVTDHTSGLTIANGLDEKRIVKQWAEIDRVNKKLKATGIKCQVLKGTECDILRDGSLDLPDTILAKLEVVGVSVHSRANLPRKEQTERIIRAMENGHVDILFHPTGRIVGARPPYEVDMEAIIAAAKRTRTILEINALARLDLKDEHIRLATKQGGVRFAIDSDAHTSSHFDALEYGIAQARRGWCEKKDVVNTLPVEKMLEMLK